MLQGNHHSDLSLDVLPEEEVLTIMIKCRHFLIKQRSIVN